MRITTEYTIWCERCSLWAKESGLKKSTFIKLMLNRGWRTRVGKTCCPDCVKELKCGAKWWDDVGLRRQP